MALDFPSNPTTNQLYTYNGRVWQYNGTGWAFQGSALQSTVDSKMSAILYPENNFYYPIYYAHVQTVITQAAIIYKGIASSPQVGSLILIETDNNLGNNTFQTYSFSSGVLNIPTVFNTTRTIAAQSVVNVVFSGVDTTISQVMVSLRFGT